MEAEATSELQKMGVQPTVDKDKYIWNKVGGWVVGWVGTTYQVSR